MKKATKLFLLIFLSCLSFIHCTKNNGTVISSKNTDTTNNPIDTLSHIDTLPYEIKNYHLYDAATQYVDNYPPIDPPVTQHNAIDSNLRIAFFTTVDRFAIKQDTFWKNVNTNGYMKRGNDFPMVTFYNDSISMTYFGGGVGSQTWYSYYGKKL